VCVVWGRIGGIVKRVFVCDVWGSVGGSLKRMFVFYV